MDLPAGLDLVVIARASAVACGFPQLTREVEALVATVGDSGTAEVRA